MHRAAAGCEARWLSGGHDEQVACARARPDDQGGSVEAKTATVLTTGARDQVNWL